MSAARSQLSKDFDERGGSERVRGERGLEKAQKKIPQQTPFSRVRSLPNLSQPPLILQSPFLIFCPPSPLSLFVASHLLPLSDPHHSQHIAQNLSSQPHTQAAIRQDSASASISRVISIWQRASRLLRHSPVPPHPALLVTWDNWGRNPDCETDCGSRSEQHAGDQRMFLKLYQKKIKNGGGIVMGRRWRRDFKSE